MRNWRVPGEADGEPFEIVGFLGYRSPVGEHDDEPDSPTWGVALAAGVGGLIVVPALALPLLRREGEDRDEGSVTE